MSLRTARESAALESYRVARQREAAYFRAQRNLRWYRVAWAAAMVGLLLYAFSQGRS